jgi:dolichol-phosphate mannosyltransferase
MRRRNRARMRSSLWMTGATTAAVTHWTAWPLNMPVSASSIIIQIDGDLQQDTEDILKLLPLTNSYDLVCGWRQQRQDGFVKMISSRIANRVRNVFTHDGVHDTGCPLKVFRRPVLERIRLFEGMHRFFPALALMYGFTVTEVPVRHYPRIHGVSKYGMGNRLFKSLYDLIAVRWMQQRVLLYKFRGTRDVNRPRVISAPPTLHEY